MLGRGGALGEAREPLVSERAQTGRALVSLSDLATDDRIVGHAPTVREIDEPGDRLLKARDPFDPESGPFVCE